MMYGNNIISNDSGEVDFEYSSNGYLGILFNYKKPLDGRLF